jgi:hypothetical protein
LPVSYKQVAPSELKHCSDARAEIGAEWFAETRADVRADSFAEKWQRCRNKLQKRVTEMSCRKRGSVNCQFAWWFGDAFKASDDEIGIELLCGGIRFP